MKLDRLLGILTVLLQQESVTAPYLAERYEVSRRTISRDIDALCQAGIPIITRQGSGGGISIAEGFKLDKSVLTVEEITSLVAGVKGIGSVTQEASTQNLLDKFQYGTDTVVSLRESIVIDLASHYKGSLTEKIGFMKEAIRNNYVIEFDYYYDKGESHRRIEPYTILFKWTSWYIFGFCLERKDWRMFKVARLWNLSTDKECYHMRSLPDREKLLDSFLPDDKTLIALFDPSLRYRLIETYGLHCYTETESGFLRLEVEYTNEDFIVSWLLGFGDKVKVLEPKSIIETIQKIAYNLFNLY